MQITESLSMSDCKWILWYRAVYMSVDVGLQALPARVVGGGGWSLGWEQISINGITCMLHVIYGLLTVSAKLYTIFVV